MAGRSGSPATRNHIWLINGGARYAELLYLEHVNGAGALENEVHDYLRRSVDARECSRDPIGASRRLFARILGRNGGQRRGGAAHAARGLSVTTSSVRR